MEPSGAECRELAGRSRIPWPARTDLGPGSKSSPCTLSTLRLIAGRHIDVRRSTYYTKGPRRYWCEVGGWLPYTGALRPRIFCIQ
ncbi:uncharacterized protein TrAFT101_001823 [Trichoderma asperellum]|uniref:uncharacterized protein n=1 Tax=Trichoderma asperellum TaxID=101201 RepID=UPI00332E6623|nr:hypothetical protein TrAFT101_001823 [Trichoderma asperellum]